MSTSRHALGQAIDAGRWDAEAPLGRIILVAHAAFLNAGFIPCGNKASRRVPEQVGLTASTLSLRYTIPELVQSRGATADAAVLRLCAHGNFLILYGYLAGDGSRPGIRWACVDALFVAPILSGDLDATVHALSGDSAVGVRLWKAVADGMGRHLFIDICAKNVTLLPPRFVSLPADMKASVLRKLAGADLAMAECTCIELRDLITDCELWKARYMAEKWSPSCVRLSESEILGACRGWKEKYVTTRKRQRWWLKEDLPHVVRSRARSAARRELDRCKRQDPTEHLVRRFKQMNSKAPVGDGGGRRQATAVHGNGQRRCGKEAIYSSSAPYGRMHR